MKATLSKVEKRIEIKPSKTDGIDNYDIDNAYPQRIIDIINSSGTGTLCTDIMAKFIYGEGFENEEFGKMKVNSKGITANQLLFKFAKSLARFNGFTSHVNFNGLYQKTSIDYIPFEDVRFTTSDNKKYPNMLAVYHDWQKIIDRSIKESNIDFINFYNPKPNVIQEQVDKQLGETLAEKWANYNGQILYYTPDGIEYPLAPSDSVLEDIQTDSQAKIFKFRNITTNFMASHILEIATFESDEEKAKFEETLKQFQGSDNTSQILLFESESGVVDGEGSFKLTKIDIQDIEKLYEFTENSVRDNIIRNYLIPPVLLLAVAGKLGSSSEIKDATAFYNGMTKDYRLQLEETFKELFTNFVGVSVDDFSIKELSPQIVKTKDTTEGKTKVVEVLSSTVLTPNQKKNILINIYDYSLEDANLLTTDISLT